MKTFKYNINGRELCIRVSGEDSTISDILVDGEYPQVAESEMTAYAAVISLALLENDIEVVHDDEPDVITLVCCAQLWVAHPVLTMSQCLRAKFSNHTFITNHKI